MRVEVCAIMRNEARYLREWVAWYSLLGFDQITIYNNQSTDHTPEILADYQAKGILAYHEWPDPEVLAPQFTAYWHAFQNTHADWLLFVDADEFLVLHQHENVHDYLRAVGDGADSVSVSWAVFGSDGQEAYRPDLLCRRFTKRGPEDTMPSRHVKSFIRPAALRQVNIHRCRVAGQAVMGNGAPFEHHERSTDISSAADYSVAQINHYVLKSREEFEIKKRRGSANRRSDDPMKMTRLIDAEARYWKSHDLNQVEDRNLAAQAETIETQIKAHMAAPKLGFWSKLARRVQATYRPPVNTAAAWILDQQPEDRKSR